MKSTPADPNASLVTIVDRSQGDQGLLLSFEVSDSTGFASASFQFEIRDANGNWLNSVSAWANDWSSAVSGGDARNGKHVVMLEIPASAEEGVYQLSSFSLRDQAGNEDNFHRNTSWSDSARAALGIDPDTLNFSVSGQGNNGGDSGTDAELPVLSNISLSDRTIDRNSGERGTLLSLSVTDQTGFTSAVFGFEARDSYGRWLDSTSVLTDSWSTLVNGGSDQSGSHVGLINITPTTTAGNYELSYFSLRDEAGNQQHFNREFNWDYVGNDVYKPSYTWSDAAIQTLGVDPSTLSFSVTGEAPEDSNTDNALPKLTNIKLDDSLIEIDAGETGTLLSFEASDATGLSHINFSFSLTSSSGEQLNSVSAFGGSNSLANESTEKAGKHFIQIEVPTSAIAGVYELNSLSLSDQAGNSRHFSRYTAWSGSGYGTTATQAWDAEAITALGTDPSSLKFTVTNSGVLDEELDKELPVINKIGFVEPQISAPGPSRVYSSGELIELEIELADAGVGLVEQGASGSGYSSPAWIGNLTFRSPQGQQTVYHSLTSADRISGDANQGVYRVTLSLDASHEPGEWTLSDLSLEDANGNRLSAQRQYGSGDWDSPITALQRTHLATRLGVDPADLSFTFINPDYVRGTDGSTDRQAPLLSGFRLELSDPAQPDSWAATFSLTDPSGIGNGSFSGSGYGSNSWIGNLEFVSADGQQRVYTSIESGDRVSGDAQSGSYSVALPLDATHKPGEWTLTSLYVRDVLGNQFSAYRPSNGSSEGPVSEIQRAQMAARLGLTPEALTFDYVNPAYAGENTDQAAPTLTSFSLGLSDSTDPTSWTATISLTDTSGVGYSSASGSGYGSNGWIGSLDFISADGQQRIFTSVESSDRVSGDAQSGSYTVAIPLDETHQPGEWTLRSIYIIDASGNDLSVYRQSNGDAWDAPITELQREHMAARLGLTPEALSFTYTNPLYSAGASDTTPPILLSLNWSPSGNQLPQPSAPDLEAASDSGSSETDNITNATTPTITGVATPGSTISWLLDGVLHPANTAITTADPQTGEWSYTLPAEHAATADGDYTLTVIATDADGNVSAPSDPLVITIDLTSPTFNSSLEASSIEENSGSGQIVYTASASDTHEVLYSLKGDEPFEIDPLTGSVRMTINPDYETQAAHSFTVVATDVAGNSAEQQVSLAVLDTPEVQAITLSIPDVVLQPGKVASIPINVDEAKGIESIDLTLAYDPAVFQLPQNGALITASALSAGGTWAANTSTPGEIVLSWYGTAQLPAGAGALGALNLEVSADAQPGTSPLLEMTAALVSEGLIPSNLSNGNTTIVAPSFQVLNARHTPNGLALRLSEAPDMAKFNLYDGQDVAVDAPDLELRGADGKAVALSAHWQAEELELHLLAANALGAGEYTLTIAARSDGLVSAGSGEVLDGNGDGINGDNYVLSFSRQGDEPFLAVADTARGGGQALSLNGDDFRDGLTGLPVLLSSSEALRSLSGSFVFDAKHFLNADLRAGSALPDDWVLTLDPASGAGRIVYSAGGNSTISGNNLELFRFDALVAPETTDKGVYASTALIEATATATRADNTNLELNTDPGLVALAYSGDATGDGTLSSMDASRVQRTVVGLDSGFDAYDDINPTLIGDTTGNGTLSSLDAARIQQQVVGMSVDSYPKSPI